MRWLRTQALPLLLLACDCAGMGLPSALAPYRQGYEVTQVSDWSSPGLTFYRVTMTDVQDLSSTSIVAVDQDGNLVEGAALFVRFAALPPEELAERACATLLAGCTPLGDADPSAASWLGGDASRVQAPHLDGHHLVFDVVEGDMAPHVVRVTVDTTNGNVLSRDPFARLAPAPSGPALPAAGLPDAFEVTVGVTEGSAPHWVTASLDTTHGTITGCVSTVAGACAASVLVTLDADAIAELAPLHAAVLAIPRCEPEGISAGDLDYTLSWPSAPRPYTGHVPPDESQMAGRNGGECRADARLAWWIARHVRAESRPLADAPDLTVTLDASREEPRFVNAHVDFAAHTVWGCTASVAGSCRATHTITLDDVQAHRLRTLVEDVRSEPCHVPFPAGAPLAIEMGMAYDGRCGADAALAWWVAGVLDPTAMGANSGAE